MAMALPLPSTADLTAELERLRQEMALPETARTPARLKELTRDYGHKEKLREVASRREALLRAQAEAQDLVASGGEMRELAEEELRRTEAELKQIEATLEELLLPHDARDSRDIILEIRAGAGGEEASLFAQELFRAYSRYAERQGWQMHTVSTSPSEQGGFKEVVAELKGEAVFGSMKFERGVHRVQRVPATEKQGRIHTSTVTVAVLPQAEEVDIVIRPEDLRVDTYRASGAGGQHVNKTSSAVRITHLPTNTVVAVQDERSQHKNRDKAMKILRSRILAAQEEKRASEEAQQRRSQIGTGDRSEKIRTYNFPQDRITDHRIKHSWGNIAQVMEGAFNDIFQVLKEEERKLLLKQAQ
jgi:peptide chain release factor 1